MQTMHFFVGSQQRRHQDSYYLPSCLSAWIALEPISERNGTIWVQPGSHRGKLLTRADFIGPNGEPAPTFGEHYNDAVDALYESHGVADQPVRVNTGDVVLFDGTLIHRGGPIGEPGSSRHVHACHYVPHDNHDWHYGGWPRISFDHVRHHGHQHA